MRQPAADKDVNAYSFRSRYQATTGEHTAGLEDLVCDVVNCRAREFVTTL